MKQITIPENWPFEHIPTWEYDENGDIEVSNFMCGECVHHHKGECKCLDHKWVHFFRPYFSCDVGTARHTICREFIPHPALYPAGCVEWDYLGVFDGWYRLWVKQWHHGHNPPWTKVPLIRASHTEGREHSDNCYYVSYDDFVNCNIMRDDGIRCLGYSHIERTRNNPIGYMWVHEGPGVWVPWDGDRYDKGRG